VIEPPGVPTPPPAAKRARPIQPPAARRAWPKNNPKASLCTGLARLVRDVLPSLIRLAGVAQPGRAADL
jgi:hypothetical protein